jgi:GNAT superfamily N-acetyltransferase
MSRLTTTVTYLEMKALPSRPAIEAPQANLTLVRAHRPTTAFYRWLYERVGAPWLWTDRRRLDDAALRLILDDDRVEVWVCYVAGVPAGYFELDRRLPPDIELAYFGLLPEFIGQRLGPWLLDRSIATAWSYAPARFWVHTQTLDHPRALPLYRDLGFVAYKEEPLVMDVQLDL